MEDICKEIDKQLKELGLNYNQRVLIKNNINNEWKLITGLCDSVMYVISQKMIVIGEKVCIVNPHTDLVCDSIVTGQRHCGLETSTIYVLKADNKFDFYNTFF